VCRLLNRRRVRYLIAGGALSKADLIKSKQTGRPSDLADTEQLEAPSAQMPRLRRRRR
jgi:hypothetical protein